MVAQELVNTLFDHIKEQNALTSDEALARHIGVPGMYIWRWRRGEYSASTKILLPLVALYGTPAHSEPRQIAQTHA